MQWDVAEGARNAKALREQPEHSNVAGPEWGRHTAVRQQDCKWGARQWARQWGPAGPALTQCDAHVGSGQKQGDWERAVKNPHERWCWSRPTRLQCGRREWIYFLHIFWRQSLQIWWWNECGWETKGRVKNNTKTVGLRKWQHGVTVHRDREHCSEQVSGKMGQELLGILPGGVRGGGGRGNGIPEIAGGQWGPIKARRWAEAPWRIIRKRNAKMSHCFADLQPPCVL